MTFVEASDFENLLANLVHDLRQPLSNIESTTYWLSSLANSCDPRITEQLRIIERQVEQAETLLAAASSELARVQAQRREGSENLELTNSTSVGVT